MSQYKSDSGSDINYVDYSTTSVDVGWQQASARSSAPSVVQNTIVFSGIIVPVKPQVDTSKDLVSTFIRRFRLLRTSMTAKAQEQGVLTDEDVFDKIK